MTSSVVWTASHTHVVGRATPRSPIDTTSEVSANVTRSLRLIGARTVEGTADVHAVVVTPEGDIPKTVTLEVPRTAIPETGPLTVPASGALPSLTFPKAGRGKVVVGDIDLHLTTRNSDGDETWLGEVDAPCSLDSEQDGVLATFTIRPAAEPSASGTAGSDSGGSGSGGSGPGGSGPGGSGPGGSGPGGSGPGGSGSGSPSGSPSGSASAQVQDPSGTPSGTASPSRSGAPGTVPPSASPASSESGIQDLAAPLRAAAAFLAVAAVALGCGWWSRRRRLMRERNE